MAESAKDNRTAGDATDSWPDRIYSLLREWKVAQVSYVPDGGHASLIRLVHADPSIRAISLTTEEEGIAVCGGAWLGGQRSVMLMQSSGVGNCITRLFRADSCHTPQEAAAPDMPAPTRRANAGKSVIRSRVEHVFAALHSHRRHQTCADEDRHGQPRLQIPPHYYLWRINAA